MASVLFLAPADLGETVLATGALAHVLGDGCGRDVAGILSRSERNDCFNRDCFAFVRREMPCMSFHVQMVFLEVVG